MGLLLNVLSLYKTNTISGLVRTIKYINNLNPDLNIVTSSESAWNSAGAAVKVLFVLNSIREVWDLALII